MILSLIGYRVGEISVASDIDRFVSLTTGFVN